MTSTGLTIVDFGSAPTVKPYTTPFRFTAQLSPVATAPLPRSKRAVDQWLVLVALLPVSVVAVRVEPGALVSGEVTAP